MARYIEQEALPSLPLDTNRLGDTKEKLGFLPLDFRKPMRFLDFERPRVEYADMLGDGAGKQLTDFKSEFIRDYPIPLMANNSPLSVATALTTR